MADDKRLEQLTKRVERLERLLVALTGGVAQPDPERHRCGYARDCTMPWTPHFEFVCNPDMQPTSTQDAMTGEMEDTGTIERGRE